MLLEIHFLFFFAVTIFGCYNKPYTTTYWSLTKLQIAMSPKMSDLLYIMSSPEA